MRVRFLSAALSILSLCSVLVSCGKTEAPVSSEPMSTTAEVDDSLERYVEKMTVDMDELTSMMEGERSFALILFRETCEFCRETVPLAADFGIREIDAGEEDGEFVPLDIYFLNSRDNAKHLAAIESLLLPRMSETDVAAIQGSIYVPNLSAFRAGIPILSETGLAQTQEAMDRRLIELKNLILT